MVDSTIPIAADRGPVSWESSNLAFGGVYVQPVFIIIATQMGSIYKLKVKFQQKLFSELISHLPAFLGISYNPTRNFCKYPQNFLFGHFLLSCTKKNPLQQIFAVHQKGPVGKSGPCRLDSSSASIERDGVLCTDRRCSLNSLRRLRQQTLPST